MVRDDVLEVGMIGVGQRHAGGMVRLYVVKRITSELARLSTLYY